VPPSRDRELIQIVDAALADAARVAGDWLVCRPGCTQCCVGAFAINVFGPPVRNDDGGLGVCELCFHGASLEQIAACEMVPDPHRLEDEIVAAMPSLEGERQTIVAFALIQ
jgi:hypothetical protein